MTFHAIGRYADEPCFDAIVLASLNLFLAEALARESARVISVKSLATTTVVWESGISCPPHFLSALWWQEELYEKLLPVLIILNSRSRVGPHASMGMSIVWAYTVACGTLSSGQGLLERHSRHLPARLGHRNQPASPESRLFQPRICLQLESGYGGTLYGLAAAQYIPEPALIFVTVLRSSIRTMLS
jgi:hypothetical protein